MPTCLAAQIFPDPDNDKGEVIDGTLAKLTFQTLSDNLALHRRDMLSQQLAIVGDVDEALERLTRRPWVQIEAPLTVSLTEEEGMTVHRTLPLLGRIGGQPSGLDPRLPGQPRCDVPLLSLMARRQFAGPGALPERLPSRPLQLDAFVIPGAAAVEPVPVIG